MIIGIDLGHTPTSPGASGWLDELAEDRQIGAYLISELEHRGHTVHDVTAPDDYSYPSEIDYRVTMANKTGADVTVSIHLNAGGGTGSEAYYYPGDNYGYQLAAQISANIAGIFGIPDRGAKSRDNLGVISNTNMTAILIEVCFVDRREDYDAFMKMSYEKMAKAIADGIEGKEYAGGNGVGWKSDDTDLWWYQRADGSYLKNEWEFIDNGWYYFGEDGYVKTGWFEVDGHWFYSSPNHDGNFGVMWHERWVGHDGKWYYLGYDGHMLTDRIICDEKGILYALGEDGAMLEGDLMLTTGKGGRLKAVKI